MCAFDLKSSAVLYMNKCMHGFLALFLHSLRHNVGRSCAGRVLGPPRKLALVQHMQIDIHAPYAGGCILGVSQS